PPSAELFHYDSTNAVNWGMREYKVRAFCCKERPPARAPGMCPCVPRLCRGKLSPLPLFCSILDLAAPSQRRGAHTRAPSLPRCC
ncbi:hypothetical protein EK904_011209, partial [Melospiza melodia maxima]